VRANWVSFQIVVVAEQGEARRKLTGLDLAGRDGRLLVVGSELGGLAGDALKDVVDERVQDEHGLVGDTSVGVDLLEDLVDVGRVGLLADLALLLLVTVSGGRLLDGLLGLLDVGRSQCMAQL